MAAAVRAEKVAAREKKARDRKMFDEQAKAYAAQRARQRAAEEADGRRRAIRRAVRRLVPWSRRATWAGRVAA